MTSPLKEGTQRVDVEHETSPENGPVSPQCYGRMVALARQLERELAKSQARCVELEKDALRYRWLREAPLDKDTVQMAMVMIYGMEEAFEDLDAAIDSALSRKD